MKELEYRANNPDRLKNRGGQLLAEEKERKVIQRKLPKIESQLHHLVEEYETRHGETFYVNGVSLEEFLAQSYGHRNIEKECQKNPRKEIKDKSANKTSVTKLTPTASTSRHLTPLCTSSNRKLFFGSTPKSSGKRRNVGNNKVHSVTYALKIRKSGNISKRALSENKKRRSVKKESRSQSQNATTIDMTYGQFQEHLKDREECRSSLLTNQSLSTKSVFKTPNRTHVKPFRRKLYNVNASSNATSKLLQSTRDSPRSPRIESYFET
ncbi:PREDICTED: protein regulator of cytokinesis 1-like [Polistes dominula]|uniref:Protein regulator of cytokinesis 1-like n=1 Tax=Polistes dominula TaxID=743375 RepID=A0ABM1IGP1_POLDO|nr:PREDICTED: protein regulator of cytokinesis 1-like [Polistes dominula]